MDWGTTHRDRSAQKKPHGNGQDWSFKGNHAKKGKFARVGKGPVDTLPRDRKTVVREPAVVYPASVLQAARERGVSVKSYLAMARLDIFLQQNSKT